MCIKKHIDDAIIVASKEATGSTIKNYKHGAVMVCVRGKNKGKIVAKSYNYATMSFNDNYCVVNGYPKQYFEKVVKERKETG